MSSLNENIALSNGSVDGDADICFVGLGVGPNVPWHEPTSSLSPFMNLG